MMHIHHNYRPYHGKPMKFKKNIQILLALIMLAMCAVVLSSCSSPPKKKAEVQDGAPLKPKDIAHIKDAVPKFEHKSRYGNPSSYEVFGKKYHVMDSSEGFKEKGIASWYGTKFHGKRTSSGEPYDLYGMTAAHKSLPLPTYVKVKNLKNGKTVIVKVNDRGPFVDDRIIDLSYTAAKKLGVFEYGTAPVEITAINPKKWTTTNAPVEDINQPSRLDPIYLQLGAFQDNQNAQQLATKALPLAKKNNVSVKIQETVSGGSRWHKVQIGPVYDYGVLKFLEDQILASNLPSPTVIHP